MIIRSLFDILFNILIALVYRAQGVDGLNALFFILPARFIQKILVRHGAVIGQGVELNLPVTIHNSNPQKGQHYSNLVLGNNVYLGKEVFFDLADKINIEDAATISMRVTILTHTHAGHSPLSNEKIKASYRPVRIRRGAYIGACAILLPGVEIGEEAIVAAGAVVVKDVEPRTTVAGVPARPIQEILQ